ADLAAKLRMEDSRPATDKPPVASWWDHWVHLLSGGLALRPAGALALVAMGFLGAKLLPLGSGLSGVTQAGMARVRDVRPAEGGRIQIVLDESRQRTIQGGMADQRIRDLLLEAARDPNDPGLRQTSLNLLTSGSGQPVEVREALVFAMRNDSNV